MHRVWWLSVVGTAIFHDQNLVVRSHGRMWPVYRAGRIGAFCTWYVRLDFQYNSDTIILIFNHVDCRIGRWHITLTMHTRHGISTHWQLYCLFNSSFRKTRQNTSSRHFLGGVTGEITEHWIISTVCSTALLDQHERRHHFFCEDDPLGTNGDTIHWDSNATNFNQASMLHQQCGNVTNFYQTTKFRTIDRL